ncbi:MAG: polysaccharide deacetylase family protein [Planctomycetes bacterium]|nr:polysaccharide deacetylase family protein [Planctomycetota bacterium]
MSQLPVLCYHAVVDRGMPRGLLPRGARGYAVERVELERQLRTLLREGFRPVEGERLAAVAAGESSVPPRAFALTLDDALPHHAAIAARVLEGLGVRATFFIDTEGVGRSGRASWDQVRSLACLGHCIGSHGLTHRFLPGMAVAEGTRELVHSRAVLEAHVGRPVELFAAPGGRHDGAALAGARQAGYRAFFTTRPGTNEAPTGRFAWERLVVRAGTGADRLLRLVAGEARELARERLSHGVRAMARGLLGDASYDALQRVLRP